MIILSINSKYPNLKIKSKSLTKEDTEELLKLNEADLTKDMMIK